MINKNNVKMKFNKNKILGKYLDGKLILREMRNFSKIL